VIERHRQTRLAELDEAVRIQQEKVEQKRKVIANVVRNQGIIYNGADSSDWKPPDGEATGANAMQTYNRLERDKMQLEAQIQSLLKYTREQLMIYAAELDFPDNAIKTKYPLSLKSKQELQRLETSGFGIEHPSVRAATEQINLLKRELDESTTNLRVSLKAQLAVLENQLKHLELQNSASKSSSAAQDYVEAKEQFIAEVRLFQEIQLKQTAEKLRQKNEQGGR
jgi:succinoglycan biosynthesis transport protein ExoP